MNREQNGITVADEPYTHRYKVRRRMTSQYGSAISTVLISAVKDFCEKQNITQASFFESAFKNELKKNGVIVE